MARYENRAHHDVARFNRRNVRFIRRHLAKCIKRDERGFYYSNADSPPGHLLHPRLVRVNGNANDIHPAALKMDEKQHVVGDQPA
jgi:hypothetical protein